MSSPVEKTDNDPISQALELQSLDFDSLFNALTAVEHAVPEMLLAVKPVLAHLASPATSFETAEAGVERYIDLLDKIQYVLRQAIYYLRETKASTSALNPPPVNAIPTPFASSLPLVAARSYANASGSSGRQANANGSAGRPQAEGQSIDAAANGGSASGEQGSGTGQQAGGTGDADGIRSEHGRPPRSDAEEGTENDGEDEEDYAPELGLYGLRMEAKTLKDMAALLERMRAGMQGQVPHHKGDASGQDGQLEGGGGRAAAAAAADMMIDHA